MFLGFATEVFQCHVKMGPPNIGPRYHGESGIPELLCPHSKFSSEYCTPIHDSLRSESCTGVVSSPDPPRPRPVGKLEREKWKEGLVNGHTTTCSSAGMLAELIANYQS